MTDNVVTLDILKKDNVVREFGDTGVGRLHFLEPMLDLPAVAGDPVIGTLTDDEKRMFLEVAALEEAIGDTLHYNTALTLENAAVAIRTARSTGMDQVMDHIQQNAQWTNEQAHEFFEKVSRMAYLENAFWYKVRSRLNNFAAFLSIRAGYTVCIAGWKHRR